MNPKGAFATGLDLVERAVRFEHQADQRLIARSIDDGADAHAHPRQAARRDLVRGGDARQNARAKMTQFGFVGLLQKNEEFVTAETADDGVRRCELAEALSHLTKEMIAGCMAQPIVHLLESVEIQIEKRASSSGRAHPGKAILQPPAARQPVTGSVKAFSRFSNSALIAPIAVSRC